MRKKGHLLVEVLYEEGGREERAQLVVIDKAVKEGSRVKIALEGSVPPGHSDVVKRQKVAGEWSEAELLEILAMPEVASAEPEGSAIRYSYMAGRAALEEEAMDGGGAVDAGEAEGKARQRKKKKG